MQEIFVHSPRPLNATTVEGIFAVQWSTSGSNRFKNEKRALCHWRDFLADMEGIPALFLPILTVIHIIVSLKNDLIKA